MIFIPTGTFRMGTEPEAIPRLQERFGCETADLFQAETPAHWVSVGSFYIDPYPVTNAQFKAFLDAVPAWRPDRIPDAFHNGEYLKHWQNNDFPPDQADHPVMYVSWYAAMAYAQWSNKRLPTEAEWEYAARGGQSNPEFPWGCEPPDPSRANFAASGYGGACPVGRHLPNPYGLYDLAGNVWEYCLDEWQPDFYSRSPRLNPLAGDFPSAGLHSLDAADPPAFRRLAAARRVIRGGSWGAAPANLRVAYRDSHPASGAGNHVGFRCVRAANGTLGPGGILSGLARR
jgi:formylglycine-generating enzyme required for sulfatase activity